MGSLKRRMKMAHTPKNPSYPEIKTLEHGSITPSAKHEWRTKVGRTECNLCGCAFIGTFVGFCQHHSECSDRRGLNKNGFFSLEAAIKHWNQSNA